MRRRGNLVKMVAVQKGTPYGRHAVYPDFNFHFLRVDDVVPPEPSFKTCTLTIDPELGRSKTCEHGVRFVWA